MCSGIKEKGVSYMCKNFESQSRKELLITAAHTFKYTCY